MSSCTVYMSTSIQASALTCGSSIVQPTKALFTWKEDDPSARMILADSFGLHAKMRHWDDPGASIILPLR